ncbi:MAG: M28 family metallopeptidase [Longimicrobiales bacterium]
MSVRSALSQPLSLALGALLALSGCGTDGSGPEGPPPGSLLIMAEWLKTVTRTLAADECEGRGPSSAGEEKTVAYLSEQFAAAGLEPGNSGSWTQDVPLVAITVTTAPVLEVSTGETARPLSWQSDYVAWTKRVVPSVSVDASELVFVGYGIVAPEYGWNDYEGVDVAGKTVLILVNDPGYATQDDEVFNGNAMTYYGRWTYKFEEAARQGATGALIVHETGAAGYPWDVVESSWTGPQFGLAAPDDNMGRVEFEGWVTGERATEIVAASGQDLSALTTAAARPGFEAVSLGSTVSLAFQNEVARSASKNVVGVLPGTTRPEEYVVYMAHWDHFGMGPETLEDRIYNGAFDNATGTASLVEAARAFAGAGVPLERSLMFLAVTAEEQGLLGSAHYAANPIVPTSQTVAAINMDGMLVTGPTHDITVVGYGNSELDDLLSAAAATTNRTLVPDPEPEKGYFYRSDHFPFSKVGIPSLYTDGGVDDVEHGAEWGLAQREDYVANRYHTPADEFDEAWSLGGAVADLRLLYTLGYELVQSDAWPNWREGNEFKAARDADRP